MNPIPARLADLRRVMALAGQKAYIVYGTDPHDTEYLQTCDGTRRWETRAWISGFSGSAGLVVVTDQTAGLWTDGRYFTQAEEELKGSTIDLFREGIPGTPTPLDWLASVLPPGSVVGIAASTVSWSRLGQWQTQAGLLGLRLEAGDDLLDAVWPQRPDDVRQLVHDYQGLFAGLVPRDEKVAAVRAAWKAQGADSLVVTALDDIAWLFNLRGRDVAFTPVFLSWAWVDDHQTLLFLDLGSTPESVREVLGRVGVQLRPYQQFETDLGPLAAGHRVLVQPDRTNARVVQRLQTAGATVVEGPTPITLLKARKTAAELTLSKEAHLRDGTALVNFLSWFEAEAPRGALTELSAASALEGFRRDQGEYHEPSFPPIAGFRDNGAIVHYHAHGDGAPIRGRGLFLLDTGAQFSMGTTDVTRTLVVGNPTAEEITDYTLVLKAHVQVSLMPFPRGTRGYSVDAFARRVLWKRGINYNHGTGHGVGVYLGAHEGPARLNAEPIPFALDPGMILSNEPGLYRPGAYGIRIENLVTVVPAGQTDFASFLGFETLTLCPYERRLIDVAALEADEREWIDAYHAHVEAQIGPRVSPSVRTWLEAACRPL